MKQEPQDNFVQEEEMDEFNWIIHGGMFSKILMALAVMIFIVAIFIGINMGHYNYLNNSYISEFNTDIAVVHWLVVYFSITLLFFSYVVAQIERRTDLLSQILENLRKRHNS
ncbi:MAG: hypothetical protein K6F76_05485 [Clostridiales bacterium]|nr:hypothetical protein [Clostridiales bacterium]